ncbi:MAG: hypothetical protein O7B99_00655 [Planctomycetota bacterium]|nr:hypothetical protein [Planctomycetota bacterium]
MTSILILKTGALGDVLRTTSILSGLRERHPGCRVTWFTARGAEDLVRRHPLVADVRSADPSDRDELEHATEELATTTWERVLSFDDEAGLCRMATRLGRPAESGLLSGAFLDGGALRYTPDAAPWFDMGLISVYGKEEADRRKKANRESHPAIFARMLGIEMGRTELPLPATALAFAREFHERRALGRNGPVIGLNTGAGGRWGSKRLSVERAAKLALELDRRFSGRVDLVLLGGPGEAARNAEILAQVGAGARIHDSGTGNTLVNFAALVDGLDVLVASDSLAMHVAIARRVPVVAFFAPTSAAEIELYGLGEKVESTAPDACSYRPDADRSTITVERLAAAVMRNVPSPESPG